MKTTFIYLSLMLLVLPFALFLPTVHADNSSLTLTAIYQESEFVTLDLAATSEISSLDPAVASDSVSLTPIENLFLGLTDVDPFTGEIVPELATSWEISEDGKIWTFHLRDDVLWYHYDPASATAEAIRPVVVQDFAYGIKRACDPRLGGYYGTVAAQVIAGCQDVNGLADSDVNDERVFGDTIKVSAPDDVTLVVELQFAAGYFVSMTSMWMLRATPKETIDEFGDDWTLAGNIVTNGAYFLHENTRGIRRIFMRNPEFNADLWHGGNIDRVTYTLIEDGATIFALYQDEQLDMTGVPSRELENILDNPDYANQLWQVYDLAVFYFGFAHDKEPFDSVHVRRAFSAIIDRTIFVEQVQQNRGVPMIHFTPPGMAHAPSINEVGVGFDPEYAREQMTLAGYPDCAGFPNINIVTYGTAWSWAEFWASVAEEHLGCSPDLFTIENIDFSALINWTTPDTPLQNRANAWTAGWGPDYADANNWLGDVLACDSYNSFLRPCTEIDDLIEAAGRSSDPAERDALYLEIEEAFFGAEGEFPIAPIYMRASYVLRQTWYTGAFDTDGLYGGAHWDAYSVDMTAKLAARNGN